MALELARHAASRQSRKHRWCRRRRQRGVTSRLEVRKGRTFGFRCSRIFGVLGGCLRELREMRSMRRWVGAAMRFPFASKPERECELRRWSRRVHPFRRAGQSCLRERESVFYRIPKIFIWGFEADGLLRPGKQSASPDGKGELFYSSDEAHIRVLAFDAKEISSPAPNQRPHTAHLSEFLEDIRQGLQRFCCSESRRFRPLRNSKREVTSLACRRRRPIYVSAMARSRVPGKLPAPSLHAARHDNHYCGRRNEFRPGSSAATFRPFPAVISSSIYRISAEGAPEELWSRAKMSSTPSDSLRWPPPGRTATAARSSPSMGTASSPISPSPARCKSRASSAILQVKLFCALQSRKSLFGRPGVRAEGTFESRSYDAQLFFAVGPLEWWNRSPAAAAKSSAQSKTRVWNFLCVRENGRPRPRVVPLVRSLYEIGQRDEAPSARLFNGRPSSVTDAGDGIDWVAWRICRAMSRRSSTESRCRIRRAGAELGRHVVGPTERS